MSNKDKVGKKEVIVFAILLAIFLLFKLLGFDSKYMEKGNFVFILLAIFFSVIFISRFIKRRK